MITNLTIKILCINKKMNKKQQEELNGLSDVQKTNKTHQYSGFYKN